MTIPREGGRPPARRRSSDDHADDCAIVSYGADLIDARQMPRAIKPHAPASNATIAGARSSRLRRPPAPVFGRATPRAAGMAWAPATRFVGVLARAPTASVVALEVGWAEEVVLRAWAPGESGPRYTSTPPARLPRLASLHVHVTVLSSGALFAKL
jgi:hypothetical protein